MRQRRILVADDDPLIRDFVERVLRRGGYEVAPASDGATVLQLVGEGNIDLVITDIIMPGKIGGADLFMKLHELNPDVPVVVISGKVDLEGTTFKLLAQTFRVAALLPKPFTIEDLLNTVEQALQVKE